MPVSERPFDWDQANITHLALHNVLPSEAEEAVIHRPIYLHFSVRGGEDRFVHVGETFAGRVLFFVVTPRNALTRVVTAYPPSPEIRAFYARERDVQYGNREENPS
jgi:uncharacterized DUF497 family protein